MTNTTNTTNMTKTMTTANTTKLGESVEHDDTYVWIGETPVTSKTTFVSVKIVVLNPTLQKSPFELDSLSTYEASHRMAASPVQSEISQRYIRILHAYIHYTM